MSAGRPLRVAHVVTRLNVGGPARMLAALVPRLDQMGIEQVVVHGTEAPGEGRLRLDGVPAIHLPVLQTLARPSADLQAFWALVRLLRRHRPDVVHTHMAKAGALARLAARAAGIPAVVHTFHGHVLDGYFPRPLARALIAIERALARLTSALVAVSTRVRDEVLGMGVGSPSQWHVIATGYELGFLSASRLAPDEARRRLGLPPEGPVVGIAARLVPIKDHDTFLAAAAEVARAEPRATFVIAGDGPERGRVEAKARAILNGRVWFLGWVADLDVLYRSLDVIVLTSRNEGTPAALIEAAAAGIPAVASDVGGVSDVVVDGEMGFLVAPGDARGVARRVVELLRSSELRARLGQRAREHVLARYDAGLSAAAHAELYRQVALR